MKDRLDQFASYLYRSARGGGSGPDAAERYTRQVLIMNTVAEMQASDLARQVRREQDTPELDTEVVCHDGFRAVRCGRRVQQNAQHGHAVSSRRRNIVVVYSTVT